MDESVINFVNSTIWELKQIYWISYNYIPGSSVVYRYIKNSYQNDPFRIVLELFLIIFAFKYLLSKKYKPDSSEVQLTSKEIDELVSEWQPESLVPQLSEKDKKVLDNLPVIKGKTGAKLVLSNDQTVMNLSSFDFLSMAAKSKIHESAVGALKKYGVGACGPPGFYGTLDVHLELEKKLAQFLGTEEAIIYAQGFAAVSSAIPAFSKRGDLIIADENVNFAIQKGIQIARSHSKFFKHNDMNELESLLKETLDSDGTNNKPMNRRFIIVEGLYQNTGDIAPLPRLIDLKKKYKFRLIVDETLSFGVLGKRGAGIADHYGIDPKEIDIITSSMANTLASGGGFCAGSKEVVDHQRLSSAGYCFSAALPSMLAVSAIEALKEIQENPSMLKKLRENIQAFRKSFSAAGYITLVSYPASPVLYLYANVPETKQEAVLDKIVKESLNEGLLLTRARHVANQERKPIRPSIRITISSGHDTADLQKAAAVISRISRSASPEE
ncbi:hypothetical protein MP638_005462 [Amoeboaphelidium occidentale]|nr:hypothetical protein MP638_005462 [Amoeboaphelidium occidentale]